MIRQTDGIEEKETIINVNQLQTNSFLCLWTQTVTGSRSSKVCAWFEIMGKRIRVVIRLNLIRMHGSREDTVGVNNQEVIQ